MSLPNSSSTVKFESTADAFPSADTLALFVPTASPSPSVTVNPLEVVTPNPTSVDDSRDSPVSCSHDQSPAPADGADKKPAKKRKSWGQVLPEPKTNLPPRKRAKTEDEKEQRRVERVLRNRRAAQSSRERKRLEVEALEKTNKQLQMALVFVQKQNEALVQRVQVLESNSGNVTRSPSPFDPLRDNPVTLSQQLFGSQDDPKISSEQVADLVGDILRSSANPTVNPASLSPELTPVSDIAPAALPTIEGQAGLRTTTSSSDLTQHPAAMLCDLPCHTSEEGYSSPATAIPRTPLGLSSAADTDRFVLESGFLSSPNSTTVGDDYLACDPSNGQAELFNLDDFINADASTLIPDIVATGDDVALADHDIDQQAHDPEIQVS
ncbi:hypothetical protein CP533_0166 [Ophiocordyceps camponoti-saundersi (nom. inval.)]|nr:hypothetical protein CP533_0166 [Ophiocordyceps camponoti-saundersi (nom. inval.)]